MDAADGDSGVWCGRLACMSLASHNLSNSML